MEKVVIRSATRKYLFALVGSLGVVVAGIIVLLVQASDESPRTLAVLGAWLCILVFGGAALVFLGRFMDPRPRVVIDSLGILDRTLGVGLIPWSDIKAAYLSSVGGQDVILLELRDPETYLARLSPSRRAMRALAAGNDLLGFTPLSVNLSWVDANSQEVLTLILKRINETQRRPLEPGASPRPPARPGR
ncbi:MAG TPA: STM3941 family protein [Candidatus Methylomirabilis sp.]|jgi:hypothetical protein|nr:STM3941 family protein [Candidatus Methylomirabilis sp.]